MGFTLRWPAWLTYNQSASRPYKSLRRGQFLMTEAWTEYNAWKGQSNSATPVADTPATDGEEANHNPDLSV
jgi:hypothetical protein